jgi:hypothetical protein
MEAPLATAGLYPFYAVVDGTQLDVCRHCLWPVTRLPEETLPLVHFSANSACHRPATSILSRLFRRRMRGGNLEGV